MSPQAITPAELAERCRPLLATSIIGFDVDGVLAPIVAHADDSRLTPGVGEALERLARTATVAIVSGRSLESLERLFGFGPDLWVIGSHGAEWRGSAGPQLAAGEQELLDTLRRLAQDTIAAIGPGAWLEEKPTSVVVHTREADPVRAAAPMSELSSGVSQLDGATAKPGSEVLELMVHHVDKGSALRELSAQLDRPVPIYLGDDVTDEDAFAVLDEPVISVRVGPGDSTARYRLDDAVAVAEFLEQLAS